MLFVVILFILRHVSPSITLQTACPTWSSWSSVARCDTEVPACPTVIAAITPKSLKSAGKAVQKLITEEVNKLSHEESGKESGVKYHLIFGIVKYTEPTITILAPERNLLKVIVTNGKVKARLDCKLEYKLLGEKIKTTPRFEAYLKIKSVVATFGLDTRDNVPQLRYIDFEDDVNFDLDTNIVVVDIVSNFLGGWEGRFERGEKRKAINNIKKELQNIIDNTINPQFSTMQLQKRFGDDFTLAWPISSFYANSDHIHVDLLAWIQRGPLQMPEGESYSEIAAERQQQRSSSLSRETLYLCHDDRFMVHLGFSEYFFNDILYEAWKRDLLTFSSDNVMRIPKFKQLLKMTCELGSYCIGQFMDELRRAFPLAMLVVDARIVEPPRLKIMDGYVSLTISNLNATLTVKDALFRLTHYTVGSVKIQSSLVVYPDLIDGKLVAKVGLTRFKLKIVEKQFTGAEYESNVFLTALEYIVEKLLEERLETALSEGMPLPTLNNAATQNLTITLFDYHVLQVSADLDLNSEFHDVV